MTRALALTLALAAALAPASASAWCRTTTIPSQPDPTVCPMAGVPVAWAGSCVSYRIDPRVLPTNIPLETFRAAAESSSRTWATVVCDPSTRAAPGVQLVAYPDLETPVGYFASRSNNNTLTFRDHWLDDSFHPPDAAAVTIVTFGSLSASIVDADTELNLRTDTNPAGFPFSVTGERTAADLQTIVTHEFGHTLGLAHSGHRDAIMWFSAGRGEQRRTPTADDVAGICTIYPATRNVACVPEIRFDRYYGDGVSCAASRGAHATGLAWIALGVACARRRRVTARR